METIINQIIALFSEYFGVQFIGIREYTNSAKETANYTVNANFNWYNAVQSSVGILNTLTDADFKLIEVMHSVNNSEGARYGTNAGARVYLESGKLPKEGTKARDIALEGVKVTKLLSTIRNEMVEQMLANLDKETRSAQSQAQVDAYTRINSCMKVCNATQRVHIWAMYVSKQVITEGTYTTTENGIEKSQKLAIEKYCKNVLKKQLPTTKFRNFIVDKSQLSKVVAMGEEFNLA